MQALRFLLVVGLLQSCYDYSCQEPTIHRSWQEMVLPVQIEYSISTDTRVDRYRFERGPIERFFVDITQHGAECTSYSDLNRAVYTCQNCPYEILIDQQALDTFNNFRVRRIMLSTEGRLVDSVHYRALGIEFGTDSHTVKGFTYSELRGVLKYENDTIQIRQ